MCASFSFDAFERLNNFSCCSFASSHSSFHVTIPNCRSLSRCPKEISDGLFPHNMMLLPVSNSKNTNRTSLNIFIVFSKVFIRVEKELFIEQVSWQVFLEEICEVFLSYLFFLYLEVWCMWLYDKTKKNTILVRRKVIDDAWLIIWIQNHTRVSLLSPKSRFEHCEDLS